MMDKKHKRQWGTADGSVHSLGDTKQCHELIISLHLRFAISRRMNENFLCGPVNISTKIFFPLFSK